MDRGTGRKQSAPKAIAKETKLSIITKVLDGVNFAEERKRDKMEIEMVDSVTWTQIPLRRLRSERDIEKGRTSSAFEAFNPMKKMKGAVWGLSKSQRHLVSITGEKKSSGSASSSRISRVREEEQEEQEEQEERGRGRRWGRYV